jgi:hypothetical protein
MKVVGTGAPMMLTVRARACEVSALREVLLRRRNEAVEAASRLRTPVGLSAPNPDTEDPHDELVLISKVLDDLCRSVGPDQPREVVGPTWLLDPIIRDAATEAVVRLVQMVEAFRADTGRVPADELRAAVDAASACTATLIALDYTQNHAVE